MKKSKSKPKFPLPSLKVFVIITWIIVLTTAVIFSMLWSWDAIKIASNNNADDFPRLVRESVEANYDKPVVSATERLFIFPEMNLAVPYDDQFSGLRYSVLDLDTHKALSLTTQEIIAVSTQPFGAPDVQTYFDMPFFNCNRALIVADQQTSEYPTLLEQVTLVDGGTLFIYEDDRQGDNCDSVYRDLGVADFVNLVKQARPYGL